MTIKNERRENPRIGISFPVACKTLPSRRYFYTVSKDLSLGGIKILNHEFIPKDSLLKLNINLIDRVLIVKGELVWCNKERLSERYISGLKFVEISKNDQKHLLEFLEKVY